MREIICLHNSKSDKRKERKGPLPFSAPAHT